MIVVGCAFEPIRLGIASNMAGVLADFWSGGALPVVEVAALLLLSDISLVVWWRRLKKAIERKHGLGRGQ